MKRSHSSKRWLKEHFNDAFVQRAQKEGFRSRAVYKLEQIQQRDKILVPGMTVIDLGAAPGGWSQLAKQYLKGHGRIIAMDILPMDEIDGVTFIQGDFREDAVISQLMQAIGTKPVDLIMSDMAPNMSGNRSIDQPRVIYLCELAFEFVEQTLKPGGDFLIKIFQGAEFQEYLQRLRQSFTRVVVRKPEASRSRSSECYLLAKGYKIV